MVLRARFKSTFLKLLNPCSSPYAIYVDIQRSVWVLSHWDFWTRHWPSFHFGFLIYSRHRHTSPSAHRPSFGLQECLWQRVGSLCKMPWFIRRKAARKCEVWRWWPFQGVGDEWKLPDISSDNIGKEVEFSWSTGSRSYQLLIWGVCLAFNPVINLEGGSMHAGLSFSEFKSIQLLIYFSFIHVGLFYC